MMSLSKLLGCNVYVSEGKSLELIRQLQDASRRHSGVVLINTFMDEPYNRSSLTLASASPDALGDAAVDVARRALAALDLARHAAAHPRLGAVDHVSVHPIGPAVTLDPHAAQLARSIAARLSEPPTSLPAYLYGAAHPQGRRLADARRALGYFRADVASTSSGGGPQRQQQAWLGAAAHATGGDLSHYPPDCGPRRASPAAGVVCVGAVPWVVNYNVPLATGDLDAARRVARAVSERGGGLRGVEAMALRHAPRVIEIACNLLATSSDDGAGPDAVAAAVRELCAAEGLVAAAGGEGALFERPAYAINPPPGEVLRMAADALGVEGGGGKGG